MIIIYLLTIKDIFLYFLPSKSNFPSNYLVKYFLFFLIIIHSILELLISLSIHPNFFYQIFFLSLVILITHTDYPIHIFSKPFALLLLPLNNDYLNLIINYYCLLIIYSNLSTNFYIPKLYIQKLSLDFLKQSNLINLSVIY
jgi:hypothetical protein